MEGTDDLNERVWRAVVLGVAVLCCTAAGAAAPSPASAQELEVDNAPVAFGAVAVTGRKVDATATITNRGGVPLTLSSVNHNTDFGPAFGDPDESCFTLDALQPGETCTAAIAFTPQALGARSATLRYNYARGDGTSTVATIDATGTGIEAAQISVQPSQLAFGSARVGPAAANQSVTVTNPATTPLEVGTASLIGAQAGDFAIVDDGCDGQTLSQGQTCDVVVGFTPSASGARAATLAIPSNAASGTVDAALTGIGLQGRLTVPPSIGFGEVGIEKPSAVKTLTVANSGNTAVTIDDVTIGGDNPGDFSITDDDCTGASLQPQGTCSLDLRFTPASAGNRAAELVIESDASPASSTVALTGVGNAPPVLTVPDAQTVAYHAPLSLSVTAQDAESDPLTLTASGLPAGLSFTDGGNGIGQISGVVSAAPGAYTATFQATDGFSTAQRTVTFTVTSAETIVKLTPAPFLASERQATLSARLTETSGAAIAGRTVKLAAGSQECEGSTTSTGAVSCQIAGLTAPLGAAQLGARFLGDDVYKPSTDTATTTVFAYLSGKAFLVGDGSSAVGQTVTFFGDRWTADNLLSKTANPPRALRGFATSVPLLPECRRHVDAQHRPAGAAAVRACVHGGPRHRRGDEDQERHLRPHGAHRDHPRRLVHRGGRRAVPRHRPGSAVRRVILLAAVAATIGSCGGQDDDGEPARADGTPTARSETSRPKGPRPAPPAAADMPAAPGPAMLRDDHFDPSTVRGSRTSPLTFVNTDDHEHEIAIQRSDAVIAVQAKGSVTTPPPRPGTYRLVCRLHEKAGMVGGLVIKRE